MKHITYSVSCACGWKAGPYAACSAASKAAKAHAVDIIHKDYEDVPLFQGGGQG